MVVSQLDADTKLRELFSGRPRRGLGERVLEDYLEAVEGAFGVYVDYAQLQKISAHLAMPRCAL
jgi:hypothetical protein